MLMLVSLMIRAMMMIIVLTLRLMYWTFKAMIMLGVAVAGAISASYAPHHRKPLQH